jgi:hypothetical protein
MASNRQKLPSGLLEFEASLHDLEYAKRLLPRLLDLPENGLMQHLEDFNRCMLQVEMAEAAARNARELARKEAVNMWKIAVKNWSVKELQEATGYDDD